MKRILYILIFLLLINTTVFARTQRQIRIGSRINNSTPDSLLFVDLNNKLAEDNTNLSWDDTNNRLTTASLLIQSSNPPSSPSDTGIQGQLEWATDFIYVCIATNTWQRVAIATWAFVTFNILLDDGVSNILLDDGASILIGR